MKIISHHPVHLPAYYLDICGMKAYSEVLHLDSASVSVGDRVILNDLHLVMNAGEFCYLKGETGAGKSSLLKGIYGLLPMTGGRIYCAGQDLSELNHVTLPHYRRKIGFISEEYPLFGDKTVFNNLDIILSVLDWPIASERERRVNEVLDDLGISSLQGEVVRDLPSGMRQKVVIARSVLNRPTLILADNPMVHLDSKSADDVMNLFINLVRDHKASVLCALSNEQIMERYPARSYFCADGTVTESR